MVVVRKRWLDTRTPDEVAYCRKHKGIRNNAPWSDEDDHIIRVTGRIPTGELTKMFPRRTYHAVRMRRKSLRLPAYRTIRPFTVTEDRLLKRNIDRPYSSLVPMFPGRSRSSVQNRAAYLGLIKKCVQQRPKITGRPLFDAIRMRCFEDGILLKMLDREIGANYFKHVKRRENWSWTRRGVKFFGGRLVRTATGSYRIDWQDT